MSSLDSVAVLGLGKVGLLAARLLDQLGYVVTGHDVRAPSEGAPFDVRTTDVSDADALRAGLDGVDAVLSCLPYHRNQSVAEVAHGLGIHYFDLTEDVPTTQAIMALAETSEGLMAPQCGLAPGFVGIVAASQAESFDRCRAIRMRVGALPQHPTGLLGYAFNWSPEGVVNEYLNDCEVIEDGVRKWVSPMEWKETIYVSGTKLEAFTTSGGLGTMCDTYLGRVDNLDYKTMRYPGHMDLMNFFFHELLLREKRELAGEILTHAKPPVDDDVVYIHVSSEGTVDGELRRVEYARALLPREVAGATARAIAWTTAASVVAVIDLVRDGVLPDRGFLRQEHVPLDAFLRTPTGSLFERPDQQPSVSSHWWNPEPTP
ncbi:MAG: saccharopine dehydrogenase family protein [Acidimicrobiia bacterium]